MKQPVLTDLFVVAVEQLPTAPYAKDSQTSKAGAEAIQGKLSRQCEELLDLYRVEGPLTDWEAHKRLGWERTTVIARRHGLKHRVEKLGTRKNPDSGIENDVYGLTYGWATR